MELSRLDSLGHDDGDNDVADDGFLLNLTYDLVYSWSDDGDN